MIATSLANGQSQPSPRVSVIVPTHSRGALILETLRSVFAQTFSDYEVIVVNDGSTDDTRQVLSSLIASRRIIYVEQENQGVSGARNTGIGLARGGYVALLDDDDLWPPDKLEWQTLYLDEHPNVGVVGGTLHELAADGTTNPRGRYYQAITFESLFTGNPFWSPGQTLIRTELLKHLGGMNRSIWGADDWDLWFRVVKVSSVVMIDRLSLFYRVHDGNASKQTGRLLNGACKTLEAHLTDARAEERMRLRRQAHDTLYSVFGSPLVRRARGQLKSGHAGRAIASIWGVMPLIRASSFERWMLAAVARDFLRG